MKASIDNRKKATDKKQKDNDAKLDNIKKWMEILMDKCDNPPPNKVEENNPQYPATVVHTKRKFPPLEGGHCQKISGMWTLKHEISSPKLYELLIKTKLNGDTDLDIKNFHNHIKMCLNEATRLKDNLICAYQQIKWHSEFYENFVPDISHYYYY